MFNKISLKDAPEIKKLLAHINYRKHACFLSIFPENGININSYWDEGSRSLFSLVDLATNKTVDLPSSTHPFFDVARYKQCGDSETIKIDHAGNITLKILPENIALIKHGTFCGKPATAFVYLNSDNMTKLLGV